MKRVALLVLALAAALSPPAGAREPAGSGEIARLEALWNGAHLRADADALTGMCAEDLVVTVPGMAPMTREDSFGVLRSGRMTFTRYETSETRISVYDAAAVVTGRLQRRRSIGGRTVEDDWRFTKVYVRRDGEWRVVAFHASSKEET